ncbi:hypothetical protein DFH28DRAFT_1119592 [Melampsora americana]|nr:hypothetical protein DFH28DRAFT_1119592 [Melampsora americana]
MSKLNEILGDVIFRTLDSTSSLDHQPTPSTSIIGSVRFNYLNEFDHHSSSSSSSYINQSTKLIRSQSEPILAPTPSTILKEISSDFQKPSPHSPPRLFTRSSYESDQSSEEVIEENVQDENLIEEVEEVEEEEERSPVSMDYLTRVTPSHPSLHRTRHQDFNLLSTSLPASMCRINTNERVREELLQLTQPLREGVISRERLLPASRMKQIGVGGRGQQRNGNGGGGGHHHHRSSLIGQTLPLIEIESDSFVVMKEERVMNDQVRISEDVNPSQSNSIPLVIPRPIRAWQSDGT